MKLIEGIKQLQGTPSIIPGTHRFDFPEFLVEMGYKVGAEIGVHKGEYTERFCKAGLSMYAVDPWMAFWGQGRTQAKQDVQDGYYQEAYDRLSPYINCTFIRKTSMDALSDFKDNGIDFVYIDGDHAFEHIANDIVAWSKKVRSGGIISGHDYFNTNPEARNVLCQVKSVVNAYTEAFGINPWWLFGELDPEKEPNRKERFYSWMWIKR